MQRFSLCAAERCCASERRVLEQSYITRPALANER
jgi:hypothetical protein